MADIRDTARGAAGAASTSASRSRTGSTTCCRACARRSRSRSTATTSTRCARWPSRLRAQLASIPGLVDLQVEKQVRIPQLTVRLDHEQGGARYGVTPGEAIAKCCRR